LQERLGVNPPLKPDGDLLNSFYPAGPSQPISYERMIQDSLFLRTVPAAAMIVGLLMSGCARGPRESMGHFFNRAPSSPAVETVEKHEPESSVSANIATPVLTDEEEGRISIAQAETTPRPMPAGEGQILASADRSATDDRPEKEPSGPKIWDRRMMSAAAEGTVNRLKRALSSDSHADTPSNDPFSRQHPVRVRVDGLVHEAEELYAAGELQDAKVLAERATELAEVLALDFLPNEERPEELLRKIVAAIDDLDRAPAASTERLSDEPRLPPLSMPPRETAGMPILSLSEPTAPSRQLEMSSGTVAANRPALLSPQVSADASIAMPDKLVVMEPNLNDDVPTARLPDPVTAVGLAAPSASTRFLSKPESGPLLTSTDIRPTPPQVAEVSPLPVYSTTATSRPASLATDAPTFRFVWADLWPLWIFAGVVGVVGLILLTRRYVTGH
jgi:hypothetical protein